MFEFSTVWKKVFHTVEKPRKSFPYRGKMVWGALAAIFLALPAGATVTRLVEGFAPNSAAAWRPFQKAPAVVAAAPGGLVFPLPFSRKVDRAAWDKTIGYNLSSAIAFELEVACPQPDAIRTLGLYFKSGNGWFVANKPLTSPAQHTLVFAKSDFGAEGNPTGWERIDGIRISPWKGNNARDTALTLTRLASMEGAGLVVVSGTSSCADAGTRAVAQKTAARVSGLLIEAGLGHQLITDDDVAKGALANAKFALLPYNPNPPAAELKALKAFLARGGKLGVFYGASADLAAVMGFKLGPYQKADRPDRWRSIVFADPSAWLAPPRIWQNSTSLMAASPARADARVAAFWHNARDARQPEPAIVTSANGFWMSHVLLSDDITAKKEMLVALCGQWDASVWAPAATRAVRDANRVNAFVSVNHAVTEINRLLSIATRPAEVRTWLDEILLLSAQINDALVHGRAKEALVLARRQRQLILRADAAVQPPRPGELVGVWDHDGVGFVPGDWPYTAKLLATSGVNAIFANVVWGGCAHYPSKLLPASNTLRLYGDQIAAGLAAAKARNMQYHVWMVLGKLDGAPSDFVERMKKEGRLQVTDTGVTRSWLSPHHPANRALIVAVVEELARQYPALDGIHLDYVRLPDSLSCYSAATRKRFEAETRRACAVWPGEVKTGGKRNAEFRLWRTADITRLVAEIRAALRKTHPKMQLSAAVYGSAAAHGGNIAQYWPDWLRAGTVDFLVPMNYTESSAEFANLVRTQVAYPGAKGRIFPGIGVAADESRLDPSQVARQIVLARQAGCPGYVLFALSGTLRDETLPALRQGLTRPISP